VKTIPFFMSIEILILSVLACARSTPTPAPTSTLPSGNLTRALNFAGKERSYILHIPPNLDASQSLPLVFVFHGGGGNAENAMRTSGFSSLADKDGFLVVYPNGSGRFDEKLLTWNGGDCCGYAQETNADDVGFVKAILEVVNSIAPVDATRIYATGMSNGGIMSYRLACELSDVFAAIGPVAGTLNYGECDPSEPVSVIHFHGTDDQHLPYEGGVGEKSLVGVDFVSVADSVEFWAGRDGCNPEPVSEENGDIRHESYTGCAKNTAVELYTIIGGEHAWPGSEGPGWVGGDRPTSEPDATQVMWEFFEAHPKK
jgi:polyhydroxybutyrate depolymerase